MTVPAADADTADTRNVAWLSSFVEDPAQSVVIVDFDGTLAPIVPEPPAAVPLPAAAEVLGRLVGRLGRVAVVSGRPLDFLRQRLPVDGLALFGQYGVERYDGAEVTTAPEASRWADAVQRAAADAATELPGIFVERKGTVAFALHWRQRPDLADAASDLGRRLAADYGFRLEPGRQTLELRPPLDVDKGTVTEELAAGASTALFMGDDRGDLAAFEALTRLVDAGRLGTALRIAVRSSETPPELLRLADLAVDGPTGALDLLACLADLWI
jgi:trehalose 6-phosphate phosphatase